MTVFEILAEAQRGAIQAYLPGTRAEIVAGTGLSRMQVQHRVNVMRAAGECHIGGYQRALGTGGRFSPVFHDGPGVDAACKLKAQDDKVYSRRWRKVHDKDEKMESKRAYDRMRHWNKKAATAGDSLVNALFGRSP